MLPILPSAGLQVETHRYQPAYENEEERAQKHGHVVHGIGMAGINTVEAIAFQAGTALISVGNKLTAARLNRERLNAETI
jgi:hypothetical protein